MSQCFAQILHIKNTTLCLIAQICCIVAALSFVRCTSDSIAGTGSQAGNGRIACVIFNEDGSPASGAAVHLRSSHYTAGLGLKNVSTCRRDVWTDGQGAFIIDSIDSGNYCIEVNDGKSHAVFLTCAINNRDSVVLLPKDTLLPTGTVKGILTSIPDDSVVFYIQILGLERVGIFDTVTGNFVINDVPVGKYTIQFQAASEDFKPIEIINVSMTSNKTIDIGEIDFVHQSQWMYSKKLYLNTSSTGADVTGTVTNFPVLVRLTTGNFNFNQAQVDGGDLRFTNVKGALLPYEIERWDPDKKEAEIWVKMDTVYGSNSTQFVNLYWGNSNVANYTNSQKVFDTAIGYQGVWHLGDNGGSILDATVHRYNGTRKGNQTQIAGEIGFGQHLDGSGDYTEMGNVCNPGLSNFSVCAWIKMSGVNKIQAIVSKSTGGSASSSYGWLLQIDRNGAFSIFTATDSANWGSEGTFVLSSNKWIADSAWHHVAAVIDRSNSDSCRVYLDGVDVSSHPSGGDIKKIGRIVNSSPLRFGSDANGKCQWDGSLDDCSIFYKAHSADFIKLSYMNQKKNDALVVFK